MLIRTFVVDRRCLQYVIDIFSRVIYRMAGRITELHRLQCSVSVSEVLPKRLNNKTIVIVTFRCVISDRFV